MFYEPFLFSLYFPFFSPLLGDLQQFKKKVSFIKYTKKIFELSFSPAAVHSPHTQLQSNLNGIGGSFTSHQQQNNCTLWLGFSQIIILPPNLS